MKIKTYRNLKHTVLILIIVFQIVFSYNISFAEGVNPYYSLLWGGNNQVGGWNFNNMLSEIKTATKEVVNSTITKSKVNPEMPAQGCRSPMNFPGAVHLFVSNKGNDENSGSFLKPFKTINRAQNEINSIYKNGIIPIQGICVWIRQGIYEQDESWKLNNKNLKSIDKPIRYLAYNGEDVRITESRQIDPKYFKKLSAKSKIWSNLDKEQRTNILECDLKSLGIDEYGDWLDRGIKIDVKSPMELFSNGKPLQIARWPDISEIGSDNFAYINRMISSNQFSVDTDRMSRWSGKDDVWFHGFWKYPWADFQIKAEDIDAQKKIITLSKEVFGEQRDRTPFIVLNVAEEITKPGEWYLDHNTGKLYLWPENNYFSSELRVTTGDTLLEVENLNNISFIGLKFDMCRYTAIKVKKSEDISFIGCTISNVGGNGIDIDGQNCKVESCIIKDTGNSGVILRGGDRYKLKAASNAVLNTAICRFGRWSWTCLPGVNIEGVGQIVKNCKIFDAPHSAVMFTGNNHTISNNEIHDVCKITNDAGAIYSGLDWSYQGNKIINNFVHDINSPFSTKDAGVQGIYLDDCLSGTVVKSNILYNIASEAIHIGGGRNNQITGNVIVKCGTALAADGRGIRWVDRMRSEGWNLLGRIKNMNYKQDPWKSAYPRLAAVPDNWEGLTNPKKRWVCPEENFLVGNIGEDNKRWFIEFDSAFKYFEKVKYNYNNVGQILKVDKDGKISFVKNISLNGFENIDISKIGIIN